MKQKPPAAKSNRRTVNSFANVGFTYEAVLKSGENRLGRSRVGISSLRYDTLKPTTFNYQVRTIVKIFQAVRGRDACS